jgi:hypothetical protein
VRLSPLHRDVVDHEMFGVIGDVNKMILGSFEPAYDDLDSDTDCASLSPEKSSKTSRSPPNRTGSSFTANNDISIAARDSRAIARTRSTGRCDSRPRSIIGSLERRRRTDSE